jgi:fermentation-respiration switch protein FrsA (DUF1100 family)
MTDPTRNRRRLKNLVGLVLAPFLFFAWLRWFEQRTVFQPTKRLEATGEELGFPRQEAWFDTADGGRVHAWYFPGARGTNGPVFLVCHGNGGNISHRLALYDALLRLDSAVLAFDYRGYGRSPGRPSESRAILDAEAAHAWLEEHGFPPHRIIAHGESLGGGVATELALRRQVGGLILQSTFTSVPDLGAEVFPWLPVRTLGRIRFDIRAKLPAVQVPVLVLHSRIDSVIPFHHGESNFAAAHEPKRFQELQGDHNDGLSVDHAAFSDGVRQLLAMMEVKEKKVARAAGDPPNAAHAKAPAPTP